MCMFEVCFLLGLYCDPRELPGRSGGWEKGDLFVRASAGPYIRLCSFRAPHVIGGICFQICLRFGCSDWLSVSVLWEGDFV